jgi:hypothetical protein
MLSKVLILSIVSPIRIEPIRIKETPTNSLNLIYSLIKKCFVIKDDTLEEKVSDYLTILLQ